MRKTAWILFRLLISSLVFAIGAPAQTATGSLEFTVHIAPTPDRNAFIEGLTVSQELRDWLKSHDTLDLASPDVDRLLSPDDIIKVPEFLRAYQRANTGSVTIGMPKPKYTDDMKTQHPEKYEKLRQACRPAITGFLP